MMRTFFAHTFKDMILLYILLSVYIIAVNFYSFLLIKGQKESFNEELEQRKIGDGKLFLAAFLGGAITMYVSMFIFRYRLNNMFLMLSLPVLSVLNIYLFILAYRSGFGLIVI